MKIPFNVWIIVFFLLVAGQNARTQTIDPDRQETALTDSIATTKAATDSIVAPADSTKKDDLDAPVYMTAKDSMVMVMDGKNLLYLYGQGSAKYKDITLNAEMIRMNADSSKLYATFGLDSVGAKTGFPDFKSGDQETEMEELWYNFKSKKMYTHNAITQQGEGYITAGIAKKMADNVFYMENGKYTTCDIHDHPHFYFNLTKAKFRPGKSTVTGPVYLVVEDVPLPIALPFGYFPASKDYSSGVLMPTYGDELARGFSLRDGGYYFAFNDYVDMALTGEIYTKGSWGLTTVSNYVKKYKFSGNVNASYLVTVLGDKDTKNLPNTDYSLSRDMKITWSHRQDPKANPYSTLSANVNFSTSSYNRNNFSGVTANELTQNTKSSSVSYSYRSPTLPLSISATTSINQISKDSTMSVSFPDMTISLSSIYPFKRKEQIGSERWYEKIYFSYTGTIKNSITNVKENQFLKQNVFKDWKNGMKHSIPISASFNILKYITLSTSANYNENWYSNKSTYGYNFQTQSIVPIDTLYGLFRTFDYNGSISLNTKLYGMFSPLPLFGKWTKGIVIRHVITPAVSFSGAPDFTNPKLGMYQDVSVPNNSAQSFWTQYVPSGNELLRKNMNTVRQSIYQNQIFGGPSAGRTGAVNFSLDNNLEMKVPIAGTDSTRKISLIDNLSLSMSYNFLADSMNWSNMSASIRLKIFKAPLSFSGQFDTYTYDENGRQINVPRWKAGKGFGPFGRFMGTSASYPLTINNGTLKKLFKRGSSDDSSKSSGSKTDASTDQEGDKDVNGGDGNTEKGGASTTHKSLLQSKKEDGNYDSDGYLIFTIPWNLSFNYSISYGYDRDLNHFNKVTREYPYKITHTLGINGDISPTKSWKFSFNASYDFDVRRIVNMYCSLSRQMHCWSMSATIVPFGPVQNYSFTIAVNSSLLQDVKYEQRSNYRDALNWGY